MAESSSSYRHCVATKRDFAAPEAKKKAHQVVIQEDQSGYRAGRQLRHVLGASTCARSLLSNSLFASLTSLGVRLPII